jgi:hypothetical protein
LDSEALAEAQPLSPNEALLADVDVASISESGRLLVESL